MKFGVVIFPGSNCDEDMVYALQEMMEQQVIRLWHKQTDLSPDIDAIVLPGGFSYGDYLRSGAIARYSPVMEKVIEFANNGGFVFGVCNGFQILCESGLLPGALLHNPKQKFICKNVYIKAVNNSSRDEASLVSKIDTSLVSTINTSPISKIDTHRALKIPIAHREGRYFADKKTLKQMNKNGQILFRYCDEKGNITEEANPNGSQENIAGVCNENKNVFGMMPHPERAADDELGNTDGKHIFESIFFLAKTQRTQRKKT